MCGIAGLFRLDGSVTENDSTAVEVMTQALRARGPDDGGIYKDANVVLGNRRLAIIDITPTGHQPVCNEDGSIWVTYNGEIYNFQEVRETLIQFGHRFTSGSDTEVLVHGYEQWGIEGVLERIRGMFAFALYDGRGEAKMFLCRDRVGIKPVYYAHQKQRFIAFASEVRALCLSGLIPTAQNATALIGYLLFGSVPAPATTVEGISILPPGTFLSASREGLKLCSYYNVGELLLQPCDQKTTSQTSLQNSFRDVLKRTVDSHLISEAPLGVFLSGGIDSSALVALASQRQKDLTTLGVVFDEESHSEDYFQDLIATRFATRHHRIRVTLNDFQKELESFFAAMDQPTIDGLNTYFVAKSARQVGLKAVLSGVGADEIFGGYNTVKRVQTLNRLRLLPEIVRNPIVSAGSRKPYFEKLSFLKRDGNLPLYLVQRGLFTPQRVARLLDISEGEAWGVVKSLEPERAPSNSAVLQQAFEMRYYLVDQLLRDTDVFGMSQSLEVRVPFLDHLLVEATTQSPAEMRLSNGLQKPLLTRSLQDLLPREIVMRPKKGFTLPIDIWLRSSKDLRPDPGPILKAAAYDDVWTEFMCRRLHWSRVWALVVLSQADCSMNRFAAA